MSQCISVNVYTPGGKWLAKGSFNKERGRLHIERALPLYLTNPSALEGLPELVFKTGKLGRVVFRGRVRPKIQLETVSAGDSS